MKIIGRDEKSVESFQLYCLETFNVKKILINLPRPRKFVHKTDVNQEITTNPTKDCHIVTNILHNIVMIISFLCLAFGWKFVSYFYLLFCDVIAHIYIARSNIYLKIGRDEYVENGWLHFLNVLLQFSFRAGSSSVIRFNRNRKFTSDPTACNIMVLTYRWLIHRM